MDRLVRLASHVVPEQGQRTTGSAYPNKTNTKPCSNNNNNSGHNKNSIGKALRLQPSAGEPREAAETASNKQLLAAAKTGDSASVEAALQCGADVNWKDSEFFLYTALHLAAAGGHVEACRLLLAAGAAIDPRSESDETPLLMAARASKAAVCDFLLLQGADAQARTNYRKNARSAQEFLDEMYEELGAPARCGLGSS
ncbi:unnamed protein product [Polarella glacialis]|uniref:Uncharacterized protein n=1 Tax=Polarella glacialis TaxID=89957 RepID=A0A813LPH4_POLGL|nr:unnamed protein product [Polarella glacialis]